MAATTELELGAHFKGAGALAELVSAWWANESVLRVAYAVHEGLLHIWVVLRDADGIEGAILAERDFRRAAGEPPVAVRFFPLNESDVAQVPTCKTLFERTP